MDTERTAFLIIGLVVLIALFVVGTSTVTGNAIMDAGSATSPIMGAVILVAFIVAAFLVIRVLVPEGGFHE